MRLFIAIAYSIAWPIGAASAASDADSTRAVTGDSFGSAPLSQGVLLSRYFAHAYAPPPPTYPGLLTISLNPFERFEYEPASRLDAVLFGAGSAGTLAMFLGAIGNTLGAFDEDTTWIMTGAAAAAGALYEGSRYRVRATLRPEPWTLPTGPPPSP